MAVDGDAARTLGRLARERWLQATGNRIKRARGNRLVRHWPPSVEPDVQDVPIAIARTEPEFTDRPEVREVEQLLTDLLKAARQWIYIETQYFTSAMLAEVLADRLQESDGPEVVLILHPNSDGWLEQHTMDVLRGRVLKRLRAVDRFHRLGLYYPYLPDLKGQCISMHSKVCIVDHEYVRIGSANMSNRSMGFDSECDLALEANGDPVIQERLGRFRNGLLAEHLDVSVDRVRDAIDAQGSLIPPLKGFVGVGARWKSSTVRFPPKWTNGCLMPSSSILLVPMRRSWCRGNTVHPPFGRSCSGLRFFSRSWPWQRPGAGPPSERGSKSRGCWLMWKHSNEAPPHRSSPSQAS